VLGLELLAASRFLIAHQVVVPLRAPLLAGFGHRCAPCAPLLLEGRQLAL
jgi:hypothetical protein